MTIVEITADMDSEDRNVAHSRNAMAYFEAGDMDSAAAEVALDRGYFGTFAEWREWAARASAERKATDAAWRSFAEMSGY